ncbi:MAG: hypothetical protein NTX45_04135 [Proteobacteria bacterium]|nr:hypothetical protein [Pseudomonadota bacterium]
MSTINRFLLLATAVLLLSGTYAANAEVLNVEFKFTPFVGDTKQDHVESVPGKAKVFINNIPVAERDIEKQELPVLFDDREIASSVWVPVASMGSAVRKGKNSIRIEFEPSQSTPYNAQFSWASVSDQSSGDSEGGSVKATNQTGEGKEEKKGSGKIVFEREFVAGFATDRPWHHYPAVTAVSEEDKQRLVGILKDRADAFKPKFVGIYSLLEGKPGINLAAARKAKCLDKAYAAGVRMAPPSPAELEFVTTGNPEIVVRRKEGPLFQPDRQAFARIKGDELQMCAGILLSLVYPPQLTAVHKPDGLWEAVD